MANRLSIEPSSDFGIEGNNKIDNTHVFISVWKI